MALGEYNFDIYKLYLLTCIIYNYSLGMKGRMKE